MQGLVRRTAVGLLRLSAIGTAIATGVGFAGDSFWALDLFSHFRVQYFLVAFVSALLLFVLERKKLSYLCAIVALANLAVIVPLYPGVGAPLQAAENDASARLMLLNLNSQNHHTDRVLNLIDAQAPDVVVFLEFTARWRDELRPLETVYAYRVHHPRYDNFGMAIYSRLMLRDHRVHEFSIPALEANFAPGFRLFAVHPPPPVVAAWSLRRDAHLQAVGSLVPMRPQPTVFVGDFNATPWSKGYRLFKQVSGLHDCGQVSGVQPTWPVKVWPLRIPIDHCFHSKDVVVRNKWVGPPVGSDHLPVFVDFVIKPSAAAKEIVENRNAGKVGTTPSSSNAAQRNLNAAPLSSQLADQKMDRKTANVPNADIQPRTNDADTRHPPKQ